MVVHVPPAIADDDEFSRPRKRVKAEAQSPDVTMYDAVKHMTPNVIESIRELMPSGHQPNLLHSSHQTPRQIYPRNRPGP